MSSASPSARGTASRVKASRAEPAGPARGRPAQEGDAMRQRRFGRYGLGLSTAVLGLLLAATPTLACGGLIGPNGAVNLLRTTTLAGYHDGVEHYVTALKFAGAGGKLGAITPLPGGHDPARQ